MTGESLAIKKEHDSQDELSPTRDVHEFGQVITQEFHTCFVKFRACGHSTHIEMPKPRFIGRPTFPLRSYVERPREDPYIEAQRGLAILQCGCYMGNIPHLLQRSYVTASTPYVSKNLNPIWEIDGDCMDCLSKNRTFQRVPYQIRTVAQSAAQDSEFERRKIELFLQELKYFEHVQQYEIRYESEDRSLHGVRIQEQSRFKW